MSTQSRVHECITYGSGIAGARYAAHRHVLSCTLLWASSSTLTHVVFSALSPTHTYSLFARHYTSRSQLCPSLTVHRAVSPYATHVVFSAYLSDSHYLADIVPFLLTTVCHTSHALLLSFVPLSLYRLCSSVMALYSSVLSFFPIPTSVYQTLYTSFFSFVRPFSFCFPTVLVVVA